MGSHTSRPPPDDIREVMDHLRRIVQLLRSGSRSAEARVGLSAAQIFVLSRLDECSPLSINDLAMRTATHQSSVSVVASKLVSLGLLRRTKKPEDARVRQLQITPRGRTLLRRAPSAAQDQLIDALRRLAPRDRSRLRALLASWLAHAGADRASPPMFFEPATPSP